MYKTEEHKLCNIYTQQSRVCSCRVASTGDPMSSVYCTIQSETKQTTSVYQPASQSEREKRIYIKIYFSDFGIFLSYNYVLDIFLDIPTIFWNTFSVLNGSRRVDIFYWQYTVSHTMYHTNKHAQCWKRNGELKKSRMQNQKKKKCRKRMNKYNTQR